MAAPKKYDVEFRDRADRDRFGVEPICAVLSEHGLQIASSTYYARFNNPVLQRVKSGSAPASVDS